MSSAISLSKVSVVTSGATLLDDVDWEVREGERWVVLGPNGAGKTTLLHVIGAQLHPTTGTARILDERLGSVDVFELRTRIGHTSMALADRIPPTESVRDAVLSAAHGVTGRWHEAYDELDLAQADQMIGEMGIKHLVDRTFGTLSEGERKRVLIARALMTDPELLLLDEPAAGLDLGAREDLISSLHLLAEDETAPVLVLVTHHVEEIPPAFTHVLLLREGRVIARGPLAQTLTDENLTAAFGTHLSVSREDDRYTARRVRYGRRAARGER